MNQGYPPPRKRLGQHFLTDPRILGRIADSLAIGADDTVVEIGAGRGSLTDQLATRARCVVAIELDRQLAARLRERYAVSTCVAVVEGDVLEIDLFAAAGGPYLLVGNVPYNITTPIIFHGLRRPRPRRAVYLIQREVADRVVAGAGGESYGALSVNVQAVAKADVLFRVAPGAFSPPPTVESAVLRIVPLEAPVIEPDEEQSFREMVVGCFGFRRKQMGRVVRELWKLPATDAASLLARAQIDPQARPEVLTPFDFARLLRSRDPRSRG